MFYPGWNPPSCGSECPIVDKLYVKSRLSLVEAVHDRSRKLGEMPGRKLKSPELPPEYSTRNSLLHIFIYAHAECYY